MADSAPTAVAGRSAFLVLDGRGGVSWRAAETEVALINSFRPPADDLRIPIFPILLGEVRLYRLLAFLQLFQATPQSGGDPLPERLLG